MSVSTPDCTGTAAQPTAASERQTHDLARSVVTLRQQTLAQSNARVEALEQKARDLARFVETTRQQTLLQSDRKTEALEQKARDLANFVESLRNQTRLRSETEIAALGQRARDLALSVEAVREETLLHSDTEIEGLKRQARAVAASVEESRLETLEASDRVIRKLNEELEQRVLERTAQLEAANRELDAFSYSVSHDLRAPLRAIDGFSRILLEDEAPTLSDDGKRYLTLVRDNTRQMGQLVDDLLAFSRLGRLALARQTVHPAKVVRLCLAEMPAEQAGRQVEVVVGDLPPCQADPTLLKQVWTNLLSNALKYTRKRDVARFTVCSRTEPAPTGPGTVATYFVTDNGAGFDMKYAHKLFGVFQRLHRAADFDGTGVGLAIVQRIVARHGGRVWGAARPDRGATFPFTLE